MREVTSRDDAREVGVDKVVASAAEAVADIASGSTVAVGGFGLCGCFCRDSGRGGFYLGIIHRGWLRRRLFLSHLGSLGGLGFRLVEELFEEHRENSLLIDRKERRYPTTSIVTRESARC